MRLHGAPREADGVSPVVGVVLLVGIAVTLMGAIGVFLLGFGPGGQMPHAEFIFAEEDDNVTVTVASGDELFEQDLTILLGSETACTDGSPDDHVWQGSGLLERGQRTTVSHYGDSCGTEIGSGDLIRVVWESPTSNRQEILGEWQVP